MKYEEVINSKNWDILMKVVFPLKRRIQDTINNDLFNIVTHIQMHSISSPKGRPISDELCRVDLSSAKSANIERVFEYVRDADYVEYDIYKSSEVVLSFRLYFVPNVIRIPSINKEYSYIRMTKSDMQQIANDIAGLFSVNE